MTVDRDVVLALGRDGIAGVGRAVDGWDDDRWDQRACGDWTAERVVSHLVTVVGWYHSWLDRALEGRSDPPFTAHELAHRNEEAMSALGPESGAERVETFTSEAERYLARLPEHWDAPYGYPFGTVTAGLHTGAAAGEWHLHAWDLATSAGRDHRPGAAAELFVAVGTCMLAARGGRSARGGRVLLPALSRRDPWKQLLRRSGRHP